ncbi:S-layer homology domain-containing protein [Paenibacillus guangzhouensis]|uniref:S-layer homology domain-containing protein n=1 Tax=Paenibacillus guangzhouensis TaxID=1473112 RepID=UPI001266C67E|nr:S-layer homology domain-containing protein [Paenibacillus guangzhouensis]
MQGWNRTWQRNRLSAALTFVILFTTMFAGMGGGIARADSPTLAPEGAATTDAKWYQNFEQPGKDRNYGIASVGSASSAAPSGQTAYASSKNSVLLIQTNDNNPSGGAWDTGVYGFTATPQDDVAQTVNGTTYYDASDYSYFSFYVLDADAHNPNIVFKDANGATWNANTDGLNSVKNKWTRFSVPLDKSKIDFTKLVSVSIGEYWGWGNHYYFDELYFAKTANDLPPSYPEEPGGEGGPQVTPKLYQSFESADQEGKYGVLGQGSATVASHAAGQSPYSSSKGSLKTMQNGYKDDQGITQNEAWNTGIYGVRIEPQEDARVVGATYTDASNYNYLMFYVKDTTKDAGVNVHVVFKDASGGVWDTDSGQTTKTASKEWVKMTVALDKTKLDWSQLTEIQLGTYWGWENVYYYDDLYLAQRATDESPAYKPEPTKLFNDFENGQGFEAGSGATVESASDTANTAETISVKLTTKAGGWPYANNNYLRAVAKSGGAFNAAGYNYLVFYIKDMQGSNGVELRMTDADGGKLDTWGKTNSSLNKWVRIAIPLSGASIDLSRIATIDLGLYNAGTYYIDDIYFAVSEDDLLPGFVDETRNIGFVWYQSFETKGQDGSYGLTLGSGVRTEVSAAKSANPYNSYSVQATVSADSSDPTVNGVTVAPQALGSSIDKTDPYAYRAEIDATHFSHLIFYVLDEQGGQSPRVLLKDGEGAVLDLTSSAKTTAGTWTRIAVPLDHEASFDFSRLAQVTVVPEKVGTYHIDEFYLGQSVGAGFPNTGYTQLVLKKVGGEAMPFENGLPLGSFEKQKDRTYISLNGNWKKQRVLLDSKLSAAPRDEDRTKALEQEAAGKQAADFNDAGWSAKSLPMPEDEMPAYESANGPENKSDKSGYQGGVWYRKHFSVDDSLAGKPAIVGFLGVNYYADVWINGHYAGGHEGGYTPFALDASGWLNYGGDNVIAVRVDNPKWDTFVNGETLPYAKSDWFNYTGILRDAYLEVLPDTYVVRSDVRALGTDGTVSVRTFLNNEAASGRDATLIYSVYEAAINAGNETSEFAQDLIGQATAATATRTVHVAANGQAADVLRLQVPNPKLWSPASPNLYILKVEQSIGGKVTDTFYTQFGIRTLEADGVRIKLNGELAPFLAGVGYTEDSADKGPSMDAAQRYSDLLKIKQDLKANFVRTGHFPHSLPTYRFADRIGLAIWQEIPAYWFSGDAFDQQRQRGQAKQMLEEMIFSNYNRPSVWFDGVANESSGQLQRVNYITELRDTAHAIDGTRLVGQSAVANPYKGESDHSHSPADVIGMTMYFGAFYGANADVETQEEIERIHALHPNKPIIATEYGYWTGDEGPNDTRQIQIFTGTFNAFTRSATVNEDGSANASGLFSGAAWWTAYNWYTNITGLQTMGLYHMDRKTPKQAAAVLAERYDRYTHTQGGATPKPTGISSWFQSFESGKGFFSPSGDVRLESVTDSLQGEGGRSLKATNLSTNTTSYAAFAPQGGEIIRNLSVYNYLNLDVKDSVGGRPLAVTLVDMDGHTWTGTTEQNTVKDKWTRVSVPLLSAQTLPLVEERLNSMAVKEIRIGLAPSDTLTVDNVYATTYRNDAPPAAYPIGSSGWFQSFEEDGVQVTVGTNAWAEVDRTFGVNPGGHGSVKLVVTGDGANPGADGRSVIVKPQGGVVSIDASDFNYLVFYVKDMQGSNTVDVTFVNADGTVSTDNWTDVASVKGQWTKVYLPLSKTSVDLRSLKEIRLGEWNPGTYYFDDIYFAEYPTDEIPATYTEKIPEKPLPTGQIKVAMIGDSITAGAGLDTPGLTSYPAQLQAMLGSKYVVKNFGLSGRTLMKSGDQPYWNESSFAASQSYTPDIVVIQLGTNDTKSWNWNGGTNSFLADYKAMIQTYQGLPSHPKVYVNLPPTIYNDDPNAVYGIISSVLQNGVIPLIRQAAADTGAAVIDINAATAGQAALFPDKVHPNSQGAWVIAAAVAKTLRGDAGAVGDTSVCRWKDCKAGAYTIVYDDGIYQSDLRFAELHEKYGLVGTLALISDWIKNGYNDMGASAGTWAQWKALLDKGYFDVASHTVTHRNLTTLSADELRTELDKSVADIATNTGHVPQTLAYPYNATNDAVMEEAAKRFVVARQGGSNTGNAPDTTKYYSLSSTVPESTTTVKQLNDWLDTGIAKANWLILTGHGNNDEGWSPPSLSLYDSHYAYVKQRDDALWNGTLAQVGKYLRERQDAKIELVTVNSLSIKLKLTGTLDSKVYDEPLTLRTQVPADWSRVTVTQGGKSTTAQPVREGEGYFVYYEAVPGANAIALAKKTSDGPPNPDTPSTPGATGNTSGSGATVAQLVLDAHQIERALADASPDADGYRTIRFDMKPSEGASSYELRLPALYLIAQNKLIMELSTPLGQLVLPGDMFAQMATGTAKEIVISIGRGDLTGANAVVKAQIGGRPIVFVNASIDGTPVEWCSDRRAVTVRVPYEPTLEEREHPERLTIWYMANDGTAKPIVSGRYDASLGAVVFSTHHFSRYAVVSVAKTFGDLAQVVWARQAIESLASKGVINGMDDSTYAPNSFITRADAVALIMRLLDLHAKRGEGFSDVRPGVYYDEAVHEARTLGIISGRGGDRFDPNALVTRQEMMVMIDLAVRAAGVNTNAQVDPTVQLQAYNDASAVAEYAKEGVKRLLAAGIFQGHDGYLYPDSPLKRVEAAVALERLYRLI